jgi:hypothetical protein
VEDNEHGFTKKKGILKAGTQKYSKGADYLKGELD